MSTPYRRDLQRLVYWQGQTLASADPRDQSRFDALRRQLHNRALHGVDGVSFGLAVAPVEGAAGIYEVACGVGFDCRGRELVLQRPRRIRAPREASWLLLRLVADPRGASCCVSADAGCVAPDAALIEAGVELVWRPLEPVLPGDGVLLAQTGGDGLLTGFKPWQARPLARPRLAQGETVRGDTPWEPWTIQVSNGRGGVMDQLVGVQTHIDTSAAGFTDMPCYFASLQCDAWDLAKSAFLPAYFSHIADPTAEGFTFRLLMAQIAQRRYDAASDTTRAISVSRGADHAPSVDVEEPDAFRKYDVIAQLRPRARSVVSVIKVDADTNRLTLSAPLPAATDAAGGTGLLALGNVARSALVEKVETGGQETMVTLDPNVRSGLPTGSDVIVRASDHAQAVVLNRSKSTLRVKQPFTGWQTSNALLLARAVGAQAVKPGQASVTGGTVSITLKSAVRNISADQTVVLFDADKTPLSAVAIVTNADGAHIEATIAPAGAQLADLDKLAYIAPARKFESISEVPQKSTSLVTMQSVDAFDDNDLVTMVNGPGEIVAVVKVRRTAMQLELAAPLTGLAVGSELVVADWISATNVSQVVPAPPMKQTVVTGRVLTLPRGAFAARPAGDGSFSIAAIENPNGATLTLSPAIDGLKRFDALALGAFGARVTVALPPTQPDRIDIVENGALAPGDEILPMPADAGTPLAVTQVVAVSGAQVTLSGSPGALGMGQQLATLNWRDRLRFKRSDAVNPAVIEVDDVSRVRRGDVLGWLTHYADNSDPAVVENVEGKTLTLFETSLFQGDGIIGKGVIDGGIIGHAALSFPPAGGGVIPFQPVVRLTSSDGLGSASRTVVSGFDLLTGQFASRTVQSSVFDASGNQVVLWPVGAGAGVRLRPEQLSLVTTVNADFASAFATFAQKQQLSVRWSGCLEEFRRAPDCPAQTPYDPCGQNGDSED